MPSMKKVRPREFTGFLLNPHKGCATFQRFNGDPLYPTQRWSEAGPTEFPEREHAGVTPGYLPCSVAYCRWFWELIEPEEGRLDFTVVERSLETAGARGQTLQVRLMPHGSPGQPPIPRWYVERYPTNDTVQKGKPCTVPFYDGAEYLDKWGTVIREFGRRFDGHPALETVDMSYIGPWGEGAGECSDEAVDRMTRVYLDAHPQTPVVAMITGYKMVAGVRAGTGWRCDSCDDLGLWADRSREWRDWWNHLYDSYPASVCTCGAQDAWKNGPVVYEPGNTFMRGFELGFDLDFIIQQDLKYHGSIISMKSTALPEPWMDRLLAFCNDLGYRYVLRQAEFDGSVERGGRMGFSSWIENVGVAPIYHPCDFAVKLTQGNREHVHRSPVDIRKWLPGDAWIEEQIDVPKEFQTGSVMLHAGLVDRKTNEAKARFAVEGADEDGWVPLDSVEIT
jgi:hypothetical protein